MGPAQRPRPILVEASTEACRRNPRAETVRHFDVSLPRVSLKRRCAIRVAASTPGSTASPCATGALVARPRPGPRRWAWRVCPYTRWRCLLRSPNEYPPAARVTNRDSWRDGRAVRSARRARNWLQACARKKPRGRRASQRMPYVGPHRCPTTRSRGARPAARGHPSTPSCPRRGLATSLRNPRGRSPSLRN